MTACEVWLCVVLREHVIKHLGKLSRRDTRPQHLAPWLLGHHSLVMLHHVLILDLHHRLLGIYLSLLIGDLLQSSRFVGIAWPA